MTFEIGAVERSRWSGHRYKRYVLAEVPGREKSVKLFDPDGRWEVGDWLNDQEEPQARVFYVGWECGVCGEPGYEVPVEVEDCGGRGCIE